MSASRLTITWEITYENVCKTETLFWLLSSFFFFAGLTFLAVHTVFSLSHNTVYSDNAGYFPTSWCMVPTAFSLRGFLFSLGTHQLCITLFLCHTVNSPQRLCSNLFICVYVPKCGCTSALAHPQIKPEITNSNHKFKLFYWCIQISDWFQHWKARIKIVQSGKYVTDGFYFLDFPLGHVVVVHLLVLNL